MRLLRTKLAPARALKKPLLQPATLRLIITRRQLQKSRGSILLESVACAARRHTMRLLSVVVALALAPLADALAAPVLRAVSSVTSPLAPLFDSIARQQAGTYDVPAVRAAIHRERQSAPVVIFGYELSPFCGRARQMLGDEGVHESQIKIVSLGAAPSLPGLIAEPAMVAELANMYGAGLPCCFVDGENVGDFKRLAAAADDGSLRRRLGDAGALDP